MYGTRVRVTHNSPIAVGEVIRRLVAKCLMALVRNRRKLSWRLFNLVLLSNVGRRQLCIRFAGSSLTVSMLPSPRTGLHCKWISPMLSIWCGAMYSGSQPWSIFLCWVPELLGAMILSLISSTKGR
jgi:hypothetical protein